MKTIAILFAMKDSIYKMMPECDVYDEERDARTFPGGKQIIAHPPCRLFSKMRQFAKADESEKQLAYFAIEQVRKWGGVLEHPYRSQLWKEKGLPQPGCRDEYGFCIAMPQFWFGHTAEKATYFYICGMEPKNLPEIAFKLGTPHLPFGKRAVKKVGSIFERMPKHLRSATPPLMAKWLIETALKCKPHEPQTKTTQSHLANRVSQPDSKTQNWPHTTDAPY